MALETLKNVTEIGGFKVCRTIQDSKGIYISEFGDDFPIAINDELNQISFQIQNGPIKEYGVNGCQVDTIIETAKLILVGLNKKFPCQENEYAVRALEQCEWWLERRKQNRETRGVEGTNQI